MPSPSGCAVLWQSEDRTVTLLDIPRSIAAAQGTEEQPCEDILLSCQPLDMSYTTNEPKTAAAKEKLAGNTVDIELHRQYEAVVGQALADVKEHHNGKWCLDRAVVAEACNPQASKKRKISYDYDSPVDNERLLPSPELASKFQPCSATKELLNPQQDQICENCEVEDSNFTSNCSSSRTFLRVPVARGAPSAGENTFLIPPNSSFLLGDCNDSRAFHRAIRDQAQAHDTGRHFNFILLDPPWPNRSVKRTHKTPGSTYTTVPTLDNIYSLLTNTDLDMLMADDCLVGVWITNKPAVRDLILGEDGLFDNWSLELEAEWIWLKTTVHGEPVTLLDALWRKPYEIFLLGRRRRLGSLPSVDLRKAPSKVMIGVPDLHSRKPCLKALIESHLPTSYRALEVFARHLVSGWWSWGNECIKFNSVSHWYRGGDLPSSEQSEDDGEVEHVSSSTSKVPDSGDVP